MTNESEGSTSGAASARGALARHAHPRRRMFDAKTGEETGSSDGRNDRMKDTEVK